MLSYSAAGALGVAGQHRIGGSNGDKRESMEPAALAGDCSRS